MTVNYSKLWKILIDKQMNKTQLREQAQISSNAIAKMGKGEKISMDTAAKICKVLSCDIGDIMEFNEDLGEHKC